MREFARPRLVASRCLGFEACRWNGETVRDPIVELLRRFVDFTTVCPEMEIGLGCPREPIRLALIRGRTRLIQPATGRDVTEEMQAFASRRLAQLGGVDGFLLKSRSPSCGIKDVKVYPGPERSAAIGKSAGLFGQAVREAFPRLPIEDESRLADWRIRDWFLTRIFIQADFRIAAGEGSMGGLVRFHSANKLLLMAASQRALKELGNLVANRDRRPAREVFSEYGLLLGEALERPPRRTGMINVLMHALGHASKAMAPAERRNFLAQLERYRNERVPASVPIEIMRGLAMRVESEYLIGQTIFAPYPEGLMLVTDSGKGRTPR